MQARNLVIASNNAGKLAEIQSLLTPLGITLIAQSTLGVDEADEPYVTFVENALAKARHAAHRTGLPALADDSGLCVRALGGAPGVLSARYAGEPKSDARNNAQLLHALAGQADRAAYYYAALVLVRHADDPRPFIAEGIWRGEIVSTPQGEGGFGYDPLFWVPTENCTAAQLSPAAKNALSHRGHALANLIAQLKAEYA